MIVQAILEEFPPSINKLYFSLPHGGKAMTPAGKRFQRRTMMQLQRTWGPALSEFSPDQPYHIDVIVYFPEIINRTWPRVAQQKYKKRDADNLMKLLLDTISKAIGVDDANFLKITVEKRRDPKKPRIHIYIHPHEEKRSS